MTCIDVYLSYQDILNFYRKVKTRDINDPHFSKKVFVFAQRYSEESYVEDSLKNSAEAGHIGQKFYINSTKHAKGLCIAYLVQVIY